MADPFSLTIGVNAVATFALQSLIDITTFVESIKNIPKTISCVDKDLEAISALSIQLHNTS